MKKAFVLLSGGLDSTTCLYKAIFDYSPDNQGDTFTRINYNRNCDPIEPRDLDPIDWVEAVSMDYGQRHMKETEYANKMCKRLGIKHSTLFLGSLLADKNTMLTNNNTKIPDVSYAELVYGVSPTYVPFRNGLMLSAITAHAQKWVNAQNKDDEAQAQAGGYNPRDTKPSEVGIYFGAHSEDAQNWAYPDCTPEFIGAMANAIYIGSYSRIRLHTPLMSLMKSDIVELGWKIGVPFEETWSCYKGEDLHCGVCPTCRSRREAFQTAHIGDPTEYAKKAA